MSTVRFRLLCSRKIPASCLLVCAVPARGVFACMLNSHKSGKNKGKKQGRGNGDGKKGFNKSMKRQVAAMIKAAVKPQDEDDDGSDKEAASDTTNAEHPALTRQTKKKKSKGSKK